MGARQTFSLDQIKDMLLAQLEGVVERYAPPAKDSYTVCGRYFTLNPGRPDKRSGSFVVQMSGRWAGSWRDFQTGQHGDILDLIALSLGCDLRGAMAEARAFLGLQTASPEDAARRRAAAEQAARRRKQAEADARRATERKRRQAMALFLQAREGLRGTPVEFYLRDRRGIDLARLPRPLRALRYLRECPYWHTDPDTGEVSEAAFPAMLAAVHDVTGRLTAVHRTYLAIDRGDGAWNKAPVPDARKLLGSFAGAAINIWRGIGPRGGKPASLPKCPPGSHVYIAEGIEDALSCALLVPEVRVLAAISLGNLGTVKLPDNVSQVTLVADRDENATARDQLARAVAAHQRAGRIVKVWQNQSGGKDLNDALMAARDSSGAA